MKIATRAASVCSFAVLTALLGLSIFEGVGAARGTWRVVPVLSGSMTPRLPTGSAAVAWKTPLRDLRVGSIVAYRIPIGDHHTEMHRVVSLKRVKGGVVIETKGDANNAADPWTAKLSGASFWRIGFDVPKIGWPIVELQKPYFRLLATLAAAFVFLLSSRRRVRGLGDVVDVRVAEAVVGALEEELERERGVVRGELVAFGRRLETMRDEAAHRRRMHEVEALLAELHVGDTSAVAAVAEPLDEEAEAVSLLAALEQRVADVRAGTTGLAA
jgi:signal peptidase